MLFVDSLESRALFAADLSVAITKSTFAPRGVLGKATTGVITVRLTGVDIPAKTKAGRVEVYVNRSGESSLPFAIGKATFSYQRIAKKGYVDVKIRGKIPAQTTSGLYYFSVKADTANVLSEPEETRGNNTAVLADGDIWVTTGYGLQLDLKDPVPVVPFPTSLTAVSGSFQTSMRVQVRNGGNVTGRGKLLFEVIHRSWDAQNVKSPDQVVGSRLVDVGTFRPGQLVELTVDAVVPYAANDTGDIVEHRLSVRVTPSLVATQKRFASVVDGARTGVNGGFGVVSVTQRPREAAVTSVTMQPTQVASVYTLRVELSSTLTESVTRSLAVELKTLYGIDFGTLERKILTAAPTVTVPALGSAVVELEVDYRPVIAMSSRPSTAEIEYSVSADGLVSKWGKLTVTPPAVIRTAAAPLAQGVGKVLTFTVTDQPSGSWGQSALRSGTVVDEFGRTGQWTNFRTYPSITNVYISWYTFFSKIVFPATDDQPAVEILQKGRLPLDGGVYVFGVAADAADGTFTGVSYLRFAPGTSGVSLLTVEGADALGTQVAGSTATIRLKLTNDTSEAISGPATLRLLLASPTFPEGYLSEPKPGTSPLRDRPLLNPGLGLGTHEIDVNLAPGESTEVEIQIVIPDIAAPVDTKRWVMAELVSSGSTADVNLGNAAEVATFFSSATTRSEAAPLVPGLGRQLIFGDLVGVPWSGVGVTSYSLDQWVGTVHDEFGREGTVRYLRQVGRLTPDRGDVVKSDFRYLELLFPATDSQPAALFYLYLPPGRIQRSDIGWGGGSSVLAGPTLTLLPLDSSTGSIMDASPDFAATENPYGSNPLLRFTVFQNPG